MRRPLTRLWLGACAALLLAGTAPAIADDAGQGRGRVQWQQLTPEQQQVLGQFRGRWNDLPPDQQQALLRGARRWESMTPEQRAQTSERAEQWQNLSPEQRQQVRERAERFRQLPPEEGEFVGRFLGISFEVDDMALEYARLVELGARFVGPPELQTWGGTLATLFDPAGNALQLVQYPR